MLLSWSCDDYHGHGVKQVACDMGYTGEDGDERLQLVSFHSTSKVTSQVQKLCWFAAVFGDAM